MENYRSFNYDNKNFIKQFQKFYRNGELIQFEPFKSDNAVIREIQKMMEKQVFNEIISSYEVKNYKIPDFVKNNLFQISPQLVHLNEIRQFYNVSERLENHEFFKDIIKLINLYAHINLSDKSNLKNIEEFSEKDFTLNKKSPYNELNEIMDKNIKYLKNNKLFKEYTESKAEKLKIILNSNDFINDIIKKELDDKAISDNEISRFIYNKIYSYFYYLKFNNLLIFIYLNFFRK